MGFEGLILTDALSMKALDGFDNISIECMKAGADILLHPNDAEQTVKELLQAVESGVLIEERIDETLERIAKSKRKIKKLIKPQIDYEHHLAISTCLSEKSITLVKCLTRFPVIDKNEVAIVLAGENSFFESSPFKAVFKNVSTLARRTKLKDKIILIAVFTRIAAGKGAPGIDDEERKKISEVIKMAKTSIVISFGCPYVLRSFEEADILIAAYEATKQAQRAVIKCLQGGMDFQGRFPVKIDFME
jgi:hypothetical protein